MENKILHKITKDFRQELMASQNGEETSLPFIKHSLSKTSLATKNEVFQVLVIGGSICKTALVKNTNPLTILSQEEEEQPPFPDKDSFISFILQKVNPEIRLLCVNFAYPLSPVLKNGVLDGILVSGSKENGFAGLTGTRLGESISSYFKTENKNDITVTVANDTVCTLLSGLHKAPKDSLACGIVGTGVNFAFFLDQHTLVNLESANFDKLPLSEEAKLIDKESAAPGKALFEKETAGAYLYQQFNLLLKKNKLSHPLLPSTFAMRHIIFQNQPASSTLAKKLIRKSAQLISCQIAGITLYKKHPMTFIMEGSFFWEGNNYKETVEETVRMLVPEYKITIEKVQNSAIMGGAELAIT